jgi:23S rRNA pseudouridine1911/1915/1917 synthase
MKEVPFYGNHDDNMHCMVAVYGSAIEYFLHKKLNWTELEGLTGYKPGVAAWTIGVLPKLSAMGLDIRMIEPFDYERYFDEGEKYLKTLYSAEEIDWYRAHSNIVEMRDQIPKFLRHIAYEYRGATLEDIDAMLTEDRLVFVTVNAQTLAGKPGFVSHAILVIAAEDGQYVVHDPGLPPEPYTHVTPSLLWEAMGGNTNTAEVTGFKLKDTLVRADVLVAAMYPLYSRAALAKLFAKGLIRRDKKPIKTGAKLPAGTDLEVDISPLEAPVAAIALPILYEDDDCIVINKPAGVLTHAAGTISNEPTVATFLREKLKDLSGQRGGIVHRLDRATSGVLIGAKNAQALSFLQKQFSERKVHKTYVAVVSGHLDPAEAIIDMPIERNPKAPATFRVGPNGKSATTHYKVLVSGSQNDLVELKPATGRTHQLRVHLAKNGHSIVGDPLYGKGKYGDRLLLHAKSLEITLPNGTRRTFEAPVPEELEGRL